jgi:hypothetical protein
VNNIFNHSRANITADDIDTEVAWSWQNKVLRPGESLVLTSLMEARLGTVEDVPCPEVPPGPTQRPTWAVPYLDRIEVRVGQWAAVDFFGVIVNGEENVTGTCADGGWAITVRVDDWEVDVPQSGSITVSDVTATLRIERVDRFWLSVSVDLANVGGMAQTVDLSFSADVGDADEVLNKMEAPYGISWVQAEDDYHFLWLLGGGCIGVTPVTTRWVGAYNDQEWWTEGDDRSYEGDGWAAFSWHGITVPGNEGATVTALIGLAVEGGPDVTALCPTPAASESMSSAEMHAENGK